MLCLEINYQIRHFYFVLSPLSHETKKGWGELATKQAEGQPIKSTKQGQYCDLGERAKNASKILQHGMDDCASTL